MQARYAIPLIVIVALSALIAGAITGVVFLIVLAIVGLIAAAVGGVWTARKARELGGSSSEPEHTSQPPADARRSAPH